MNAQPVEVPELLRSFTLCLCDGISEVVSVWLSVLVFDFAYVWLWFFVAVSDGVRVCVSAPPVEPSVWAVASDAVPVPEPMAVRPHKLGKLKVVEPSPSPHGKLSFSSFNISNKSA